MPAWLTGVGCVSWLVALAGQELRPSEAGRSSPKPTESSTDLTCRSTACQAVATCPAFLHAATAFNIPLTNLGEAACSHMANALPESGGA